MSEYECCDDTQVFSLLIADCGHWTMYRSPTELLIGLRGQFFTFPIETRAHLAVLAIQERQHPNVEMPSHLCLSYRDPP